MDNKKSSDGYCNLWIIGNTGVGKTYLIDSFFKKNFFKSISMNNIGFDAFINESNFNVKIQMKELRTLEEKEFKIYSKHNNNPNVFILILNYAKDNGLLYEKEILDNIKKSFPEALVYIFINNNSTNRALIPKLGINIRDIFYIKNFESIEYNNFQRIIKNSIINLSTNRHEETKEIIAKNLLLKEKELDLGKCNLTSLYEIPELFECFHLEKLILSNEWAEFENNKWKREESKNFGVNNNLNYIPAEFKRLKNLKILIIGGDWNINKNEWQRWRIKNITILAQLENIQHLNVSNNLVLAIPNFSKLKNLTTLHLNNNQIYKVYFDGVFSNLKELYLSNNYITSITFFEKVTFPKIKTIDFHGNNIKDLEPLKNLLNILEIKNTKWEQNAINVAKNQLVKPPIEIVNIGNKAVLKYFDDISKGKQYINNEVKLILVGNSEVGKTTLAKYLDDENELNVKHSSTHWLEERKVTSKHLLEKIKQKCTINLFDFGGHDFFHDTHHLFFSSNTIYILLWDGNSNCLNKRVTIQEDSNGNEKEVEFQDFPLNYWLDSIKYYVKEDNIEIFDFENDNINDYNSDVLVAQNKVTNQNEIVFLDSEHFKDLYPFVYDFINISIIEKRRTDYFDLLLSEMLDNMKIVGAKLPGYYGKVKDSISNYVGDAIINLDEFVTYCNSLKNVNIDIEQAKILANYLNQIGVILFYPNSKNKNLIYIDKKWVIKKIYKILEGLYNKDGEFDYLYLDEVFDNSLNKNEKNNVLNLMMDFKIIFKNPYTKRFIAPLYLPEKPLQLMEMFIDSNIKPYRKFLFKGFIHKNIILNIFQNYGELVISEKKGNNVYYYYWKNGLIIKDPISNEIVKIAFNMGNEEGNASIDLYKLTNDKDTEFVFQIIKSTNEINSKYDVEEMVTSDGLNYIPLEVIYENEEKENWTFRYKENYHKLTTFKKYLKKPSVMKKIFISYSKQDLKLVNKFIEHLAALQLDGKVSYWYCSELDAGSDWNDEIQSNFDDSDIICFMVSPNFMKTKYIHEHEIAKAFELRLKKPHLKIIPIILDFCRWTTTNNNLGQFTGLPYTAKPVVDFDNQNMAWYIIEECLRKMIEKDLNPIGVDFFREHLSPDVLKIYERIVDGSVNKK